MIWVRPLNDTIWSNLSTHRTKHFNNGRLRKFPPSNLWAIRLIRDKLELRPVKSTPASSHEFSFSLRRIWSDRVAFLSLSRQMESREWVTPGCDLGPTSAHWGGATARGRFRRAASARRIRPLQTWIARSAGLKSIASGARGALRQGPCGPRRPSRPPRPAAARPKPGSRAGDFGRGSAGPIGARRRRALTLKAILRAALDSHSTTDVHYSI